MTNGDAILQSSVMEKLDCFTAVNASLYLSNVVLSNGNVIFGGAIAASDSTLTFERVVIDGNKATQGGGAVSLSDGAIVSLGEEVVFDNNSANYGGATYLTGESNVSCTRNTTFPITLPQETVVPYTRQKAAI